MSKQNATEKEWTQVKLLEMYLADDSFKSIADAHNAAVDKVIADDAEIIVELEAELAAERYERLCDQKNAKRELADERELRKQAEAKLHDWVYGNQQTQWLRNKGERLAEAMRTIAGMHHLPADVVAQSALAEYAKEDLTPSEIESLRHDSRDGLARLRQLRGQKLARQQIIKGPDIGIEKPKRKPLKTKPRPAGPTPPKPPKKAPPYPTGPYQSP